jgi:hypothetical protein
MLTLRRSRPYNARRNTTKSGRWRDNPGENKRPMGPMHQRLCRKGIRVGEMNMY